MHGQNPAHLSYIFLVSCSSLDWKFLRLTFTDGSGVDKDGDPMTWDTCNGKNLNSDLGHVTECDANDSKGMAVMIWADATGEDMATQHPKGFDSTAKIGDWQFSVIDVIKASMRSFVKGDWGYTTDQDLGNIPADGTIMTDDQASALLNYKFDPLQAGMWNIPVCTVYDHKSIPYEGSQFLACQCSTGMWHSFEIQ
jgi:hypothetical protein